MRLVVLCKSESGRVVCDGKIEHQTSVSRSLKWGVTGGPPLYFPLTASQRNFIIVPSLHHKRKCVHENCYFCGSLGMFGLMAIAPSLGRGVEHRT